MPLCQANIHLFEDKDDRRIVKKAWGIEFLYEVAGMLVAHSILQGGPGAHFMSPSMFQYISTGNTDEYYRVLEDIPLNMATHELIVLIKKVLYLIILI